jgi:hypothetical protein
MKMTTTAAMEILLRLSPVHVIINVAVQKRPYRVIHTQQWRPKATDFGHAKRPQDIQHESILQTGSNKMIRTQTTSHP